MNILKKNFIAGAQAAKGIAVIIDVFRAFPVAARRVADGLLSLQKI